MEKERISFDVRLQLPSQMLICGQSGAGKSFLFSHLVTNPHIFHPRPSKVHLFYDMFQDNYLNVKHTLEEQGIEMTLTKGCEGVTVDSFDKTDGETIVIFDDFTEFTASSAEITRLICTGRHKHLSVLLVWHSLFTRHANSRIILANVHYLFFVPSFRLESQLARYGQQMGMAKLLVWAYRKCSEDKQTDIRYLMLDTHPNTPLVMRLRSNVHKAIQYCYS